MMLNIDSKLLTNQVSLRSEIIGTGNNFQQKAKSQNSWKHGLLLTFREITYLIVKANRMRSLNSVSESTLVVDHLRFRVVQSRKAKASVKGGTTPCP